MKALVVFYSRSGRTRDVGHTIAEALGADVEEIETKRSYRGILGLGRCVVGAIRREEFAIEPPKRKAQDYDLVVVGAPIWAGRAAPPALAYLAQIKGSVRKVAFFVTSGGPQGAGVFDEMKKVAGAEPVAELALDRKQLKSRELSAQIARFADTVKKGA
ncbi:MAG: flavodoxin [Candidatus Bipolaricaulota bacterium]|nr:flavodoxin [Candidatus Bipolaricaulota bacterium]